ncbi:MAG: beta-lactamase family protein [Oligoflexia bacterium]|nr:beta-lactamase family protein [Oligoflexia bacterium]MBF0367022.1 beta-lactamase family protein [Oligoflexia bacterium]
MIDFSLSAFKSFEYIHKRGLIEANGEEIFFDLASITKPLTNGLIFLKYPEIFKEHPKLKLLLNHCGGLPAGGRLNKGSWREDLFSYNVQLAHDLYSDYSALRLMLEVERILGKSYRELCSDLLQLERNGLVFWKELPLHVKCAATGERAGKEICGVVNDDNAFVLGEFCSHAGLFATCSSLCKVLLWLHEQYHLFSVLEQERLSSGRFVAGWDRVQDPKSSLAGVGATVKTFGHLGFTGTSCWFDLEKRFGFVLLTNATKRFCHDRSGLNQIRREIGRYLWEQGEKIL